MSKNQHAVALGQRTSRRKAASSAANAYLGARPPAGVDRTLWRKVLEKARAEGVTIADLYTRMFRDYVH